MWMMEEEGGEAEEPSAGEDVGAARFLLLPPLLPPFPAPLSTPPRKTRVK